MSSRPFKWVFRIYQGRVTLPREFPTSRLREYSIVILLSILISRFTDAAAAHHRGHPGAYNRQRLENVGAEHVQDVRQENRSDQWSILQILQGHHSRGLCTCRQNTKFQFSGID